MKLISTNKIDSPNGASSIVISPVDGKCIYDLRFSTENNIEIMLNEAKAVQVEWAKLTMKTRAKFLHDYYQLLKRDREKLINLIVLENGKLASEANAEVEKALELTEFAISIPSLLTGKNEYVSRGIEVKEHIEPVGAALIVTPFNFPLMIPHWNMLNALLTGNSVFLKPSSQTPATILHISKLLLEAGLPDKLFNVVYGEEDVVNYLINSPKIDVVTFVGSTPIAKQISTRCGNMNKRVLALGGAKNHTIINDDVDFELVASEIVESAFGMSGQRCMATSVLSLVGNCDELLELLCQKTKERVEYASIVNDNAVKKLQNFVNNTDGNILLNGINNKSKTNTVKPTIILFDDEKQIIDDEIFGPVLEVYKFKNIEEAILFQNKSQYANGATVYTNDGFIAEAATDLSAGMIGINIGVPVPREPFGFGGLKASKFGYGDISGLNSLEFWVNRKKITTKWNYKNKIDWTS